MNFINLFKINICISYLADKCDQYYDCSDKSDELNCPCEKDEFQCYCYKNNPVDCNAVDYYGKFIGCIPVEQYNDEIQQCSDGSDENDETKAIVSCGQCNVIIHRLYIVSECDKNDFNLYHNSTCYNVSSLYCSSIACNVTDLICMSNCSINSTKQCNRPFQCNDGTLGLAFQFCDGSVNCYDKSDEIYNSRGFKCSGVESTRKCVLPQRNLYDDVAQCSDESDLCRNNSCFQCFDRRLLISSKQVCDSVFDCYDWSDECLCEINFDIDLCNTKFFSCTLFSYNNKVEHNINSSSFLNNKHIANVNYGTKKLIKTCQTRLDDHWIATLCDGRPECSDLSDECYCSNRPEFCNHTYHEDYNIGDRYCDGMEDDFYNITSNSTCPKGFEELNCPKRIFCKAGNKISIDIDQICDGKQDCDDNSDERDCKNNPKRLFSSNSEMIANPVLKSCFWIMAILVISGNLYVIISTFRHFKTANVLKSIKFQHLIVVNISIADFIMGIYLLMIAFYSAYYSGYYGQVDFEWRSSLRCSIIGSLAVLSSQTSCISMSFLTSHRLYTIRKPFSTISSLIYKLIFTLVWSISFVIAVLPILPQMSEYYVHSVEFSNRFTHSSIRDKQYITKFACRLAKLNNISIENNVDNWDSIKSFFKINFPEYSPGVEFGYYSQTSVCMPRFYVVQGEDGWEYSLGIILINFCCFVFIFAGYILIYRHSTKNDNEIGNNQRNTENKRMQRRISRIIITDFMCWIPICIMTFVKLSGIYVDDVAYIVSAGLLLPINSAFNPLLYSSLIEKIVKWMKSTL